jgi:eukaryotic-like serine/threonine-protein kinase
LRGDDGGKVVVVELGKPPQTLGSSWMSIFGLAWSPDGREVWFTATKSGLSRALWAVSLDGHERTIASAPGTLTLQDVSHDGHVLVTRDDQRMGIIGRGPGDTQDKDLSWLDWSLVSDISADGRTFLFSETGEGGGEAYTAYARKMDGSPAVRLSEGACLALSPDGKWAAIRKTGENRGIELVPTGTGTARPIPTPGLEVHGGRFFPDGQRLLVAANEKNGPIRPYVLPLAGGTFHPLSPTGMDIRGAAISPDGATVAFATSDAESHITLCPTDGGPARPIPGLAAEYNPIRWSSNGRWIYIRRRRVAEIIVERVDVQTGRSEVVKEIQPALEKSGITRPGVFVMTGDAKAWVMSYTQSTSDLYLVQGVR